ncbi:hypothetical protein F5884DRAFT_681844 [Xylogone sp. PMI_703]|nr:hypothetical protein F5884DRAFT_681844 [Xylogone sp. PMI_703]
MLIEIPDKNGVIRIISSAIARDRKITVFYHTAVPTEDAVPSFYHQEAYTAVIVWSGRFQFWNGDKAHELYRGDFAFIPPGTVYGCQPLTSDSELLVLTTLENPSDLFRLVSPEKGKMLPTTHTSLLENISIYSNDTYVKHNYCPPKLMNYLDSDNRVPESPQPYFLRVQTSHRWAFDGVMSRPCVRAVQSGGKFSISAMETSHMNRTRLFLNRWLKFTRVDHCFLVIEGIFKVKFKGEPEWTLVRENQVIAIPARHGFTADVGSEFLRLVTFANGAGIDELIYKAGYECQSLILPEVASRWNGWDELRFKSACVEVGALLE